MTPQKVRHSDKQLEKVYCNFQTYLITQGGHSCRNIAQYLLLKQFLAATLTQGSPQIPGSQV